MITPENPTLTQVEDQLWRVEKEVVLDFVHYPLVVVPVGFLSDGASVPRIFWPLMPALSRYTLAALGHDILYAQKPANWTRKKADKLFLHAMRYLGVSWWKREVMYRAVRAFGPRW